MLTLLSDLHFRPLEDLRRRALQQQHQAEDVGRAQQQQGADIDCNVNVY